LRWIEFLIEKGRAGIGIESIKIFGSFFEQIAKPHRRRADAVSDDNLSKIPIFIPFSKTR
jgi:hypothetical protein